MKNIFFSLSFILFYIGCGGGGGASETMIEDSDQTFKKELYTPKLTLSKGSKQYEISRSDPITSNISSSYYNFSNGKFEDLVSDKQIFVNGNRSTYLNIDYEQNNTANVLASLNQEKVYTLSSLSSKKVINQKTSIYGNDMNITGGVYEVSQKYLSNFFIVDDLFSSQTFNDLSEFTQAYRLKPFRGSYLRGLVFFKDNKLQEYNEGNYTDAGSYVIKKIEELDVLFIYPSNVEYYYAKNSCYILDFARIWKAKCYEKNTEEKVIFYDEEVYDDILDYLKENFISININI